MKLALVSFAATDKVRLPGLLYEPDKPTKKVAIWLHGMSSSVFYNPTSMNLLGEALAGKNIALFAFNNRGAYPSKSLKIDDDELDDKDSRYPGGSNFELINDAVKDIEGAVGYLHEKGFAEYYLLGHSTGANKICAYHARAKQNPFSKYVLAGPGDDIGVSFSKMGSKKYWSALKYAAAAVAAGKPLRIMPRYTDMYPFSAQSALELLDPDGPYNTFPYYEDRVERLGTKRLFDEYRQIDVPTLVIFGEQDEFAATAGSSEEALKIMIKHTSNSMLKKSDFQLVPGTDHSFHGAEAEFARQVSEWLS